MGVLQILKVKVEISGIDMTQEVGPLIKSYYPKHEVEIKYIGDISETANIVNTKIYSEEKKLGKMINKSDNYDEKKIVLYELDNWIFNTKCRKNDIIRDDVSKLVKLLAEKTYVPNQNKKELFLFMFENVTVISSL